MKEINATILQRSDTSNNWETYNPTLNNGEIGYDINKKLFKIGDGVSTWNELSYYDEIIDGGTY